MKVLFILLSVFAVGCGPHIVFIERTEVLDAALSGDPTIEATPSPVPSTTPSASCPRS